MIRYRLKKKYAILAVVFAGLGLFLLVLGGSYAFFTNQVTSKDYVIYTGNLQIDYTRTGNLINLTKAYPKTNTEGLQEEGYSFNITNNGNIDARYQIRLELDNSNTLPLEYIKMAYIRTKSNSTQTDEEIEPILLSNLNNTLTFISDKQIGAGKEDSYNLKLWIDYNAPNDIQGKTFKATIVVDSLQDVEDGYAIANTRPIITLNKYSDGNTDSHILVNEQFTDPGILSVKDDKDLLTEEDVNITYDYTSDGTNLSQVSGIDTTTPGVYYINYEVTDSDNLTASITRVVTVNNTPAIPTIALIGSNSITIEQYSTFTDPGVTVESNNKVAVIGEVKTIAPGTYTVKYIVIDSNGSVNSVTRNVIVNEKTVWEFAFDPDGDGEGQVQTFEVPHDGTYKLEVWGASGGNATGYEGLYSGGNGGYATGEITLIENDNLYVVVGGGGNNITGLDTTATVGNSYNGGGGTAKQYISGGSKHGASGGGGATHIAKVTGILSSIGYTEFVTNKKGLIVAAGGGGAAVSFDIDKHSAIGGAGGALTGITGTPCSTHPGSNAVGGTQTTGGVNTYNPRVSVAAGFGQGCVAISDTSNMPNQGYLNTSGGAGLYGGACGTHGGGGGGSSYIDGVANGITIAGNQQMPTHDGTSTMLGNQGNGYARITYLGN